MRWLILIAIPLALIAIVSVALITRKSSTNNANVVNLNFTNASADDAVNRNQAIDSSLASSRNDVLYVSRQFAERYGSNSSDAPYANLASTLPLASAALQATFRRVLSSPSQPGEESTLITSRALAFDIRNIDDQAGRADVVVSLQRKELVNSKNPLVYTQDLSLNLVKEQGAWKVNLAVWGGKQE